MSHGLLVANMKVSAGLYGFVLTLLFCPYHASATGGTPFYILFHSCIFSQVSYQPLLWLGSGGSSVELHAFYSQHGIKGEVIITHHGDEEVEERNHTITIKVNLRSDSGVEPGSYNWAIHDLPVEYTQPTSCDKGYLGEK